MEDARAEFTRTAHIVVSEQSLAREMLGVVLMSTMKSPKKFTGNICKQKLVTGY